MLLSLNSAYALHGTYHENRAEDEWAHRSYESCDRDYELSQVGEPGAFSFDHDYKSSQVGDAGAAHSVRTGRRERRRVVSGALHCLRSRVRPPAKARARLFSRAGVEYRREDQARVVAQLAQPQLSHGQLAFGDGSCALANRRGAMRLRNDCGVMTV